MTYFVRVQVVSYLCKMYRFVEYANRLHSFAC